MRLFQLCYEWHSDGGEAPAKGSKKKVVKTGYYTRNCLPFAGSLLEQDNLTMEVMLEIAQYCESALYRKIKK